MRGFWRKGIVEKSIKINDVNLNVSYSYNANKDVEYTHFYPKYTINKTLVGGIDIYNILSKGVEYEIIEKLESLRLEEISNLRKPHGKPREWKDCP